MNIAKFTIYLIATASAVAVVHYFVLFFRQPQKILELDSPSFSYFQKHTESNFINPEDDPSFRRYRYISHAHLGFILIGFMAALFIVSRELFSWMPHSWRDGGDSELWIANSLAGICALFCGFSLLSGLNATARKLAIYAQNEKRYLGEIAEQKIIIQNLMAERKASSE